MNQIEYIIGDATTPQVPGPRLITHICNDIGAWGKGFVLAVSKRWPEAKKVYLDWYRGRETNDFELGAVQFVKVTSDTWIANMIGQRGIRRTKAGPPIRYEAVERCLNRVAKEATELDASIHMLRIGCGLAGGTWTEIESIISRQLCGRGLAVYEAELGNVHEIGDVHWHEIGDVHHEIGDVHW